MANEYDSDNLFFMSMVSRAEILSVLSILDHVFKQLKIQDPEGLSVMDRFYRQRKAELETLFRGLEDQQPGLAARLHERFEHAKQFLKDDKL